MGRTHDHNRRRGDRADAQGLWHGAFLLHVRRRPCAVVCAEGRRHPHRQLPHRECRRLYGRRLCPRHRQARLRLWPARARRRQSRGGARRSLGAMGPVVSLTSSIALAVRDRYEYQELDGLPLHDAVTRWNKSVQAPERAAAMLRAAIRAATGPAPGPVHLEIPADMFSAETDEEIYAEEGLGRVNARRLPPDPATLSILLDRLLGAERPLILAGNGVV